MNIFSCYYFLLLNNDIKTLFNTTKKDYKRKNWKLFYQSNKINIPTSKQNSPEINIKDKKNNKSTKNQNIINKKLFTTKN
jgi:hypothetical protein